MNNAATTAPTSDTPTRPLSTLVALIRDDLRAGREAAERAALPYYQAAGEKLLEAKAQLPHGDFQSWIKGHFKVSYRQARRYMALAEATTNEKCHASHFSSLNDFFRKNPPRKVADDPPFELKSDPLKFAREWLNRVDPRRAQREAQRQFGLQMISIGYKVLAARHHPDKPTGSRDAMVNLNAERDRLKQHV